MKSRFRLIVAVVLLAVCPSSRVSAERHHMVSLPSPRLTFRRAETYEANGFDFVRYQYDVTNKNKYSRALFATSPDLPLVVRIPRRRAPRSRSLIPPTSGSQSSARFRLPSILVGSGLRWQRGLRRRPVSMSKSPIG
jgi:hypothetical protein